ncbi:MAG: hypothetical protein Unbinned5081contig1002_61 [Prokaryotic dsDNA virus sp.]|nr:MAG: hypothetical protein Unbinned5081contig1002_61 [Prokaryotic dsDNA virus sp.]|tara:strand:+ start:13015 stop:13599 length:585 start_codon:yes stop_codon:yes gene_type:complete
MPDTIRDGKGLGFLAQVTSRNKLAVDSVSTDIAVDENKRGNSYNINTGVITLTDAADTPVLYVKNNEDEDLVIEAFVVGLGPSTGGSGGYVEATVVRNPTTGTIVSGATDVDINSNRNFGSSNSINVDAYKGATGLTMTDGSDHLIINAGTSGRSFIGVNEVLPKGTSIGVKIDPQASNTSQDVYVALVCYLDK